MLPNKLFTIQDNNNNLISKNFIYMFNTSCQKELNVFSSNMNESAPNFENVPAKNFKLKKNNPEVSEDLQEEMDFRYINLDNKKEYKSKKKIMERCSEYRFRRADKNRWALERSDKGSTNWILVDSSYPRMEEILEKINQDLTNPTLVENEDNDFVLIATSTEIQPSKGTQTQTKESKSIQTDIGTGGKTSRKKNKKVRKHRGIIQTGGSKGKLKKGYRFSGKRLKSGMPEIVKAKKL